MPNPVTSIQLGEFVVNNIPHRVGMLLANACYQIHGHDVQLNFDGDDSIELSDIYEPWQARDMEREALLLATGTAPRDEQGELLITQEQLIYYKNYLHYLIEGAHRSQSLVSRVERLPENLEFNMTFAWHRNLLVHYVEVDVAGYRIFDSMLEDYNEFRDFRIDFSSRDFCSEFYGDQYNYQFHWWQDWIGQALQGLDNNMRSILEYFDNHFPLQVRCEGEGCSDQEALLFEPFSPMGHIRDSNNEDVTPGYAPTL